MPKRNIGVKYLFGKQNAVSAARHSEMISRVSQVSLAESYSWLLQSPKSDGPSQDPKKLKQRNERLKVVDLERKFSDDKDVREPERVRQLILPYQEPLKIKLHKCKLIDSSSPKDDSHEREERPSSLEESKEEFGNPLAHPFDRQPISSEDVSSSKYFSAEDMQISEEYKQLRL